MEAMHRDRVDGYAAAMLAIARAEGDAEGISDEIYRVVRSFEAAPALRDALTDPRIPVDRKQGVVDELIGGRASQASVGLINMVVSAGRGRDLPDIVERLAAMAAEEQGAAVAEVRSAVDLDGEQIRRLEEALSQAVGRRVEVKAVTDANVVGGVVAKIGDTVFDGSVRSRLDELREQWG